MFNREKSMTWLTPNTHLAKPALLAKSKPIGNSACAKQAVLLLGVWLSVGLSGCQTATSPSANPLNNPLNTVNMASPLPQTLLSNAIGTTLRHNQDWLAEHQLYLLEKDATDSRADNMPASPSALDKITACQQQHDDALVAQLLNDNLTSFAQVATLSDTARQRYDTIKTDYLSCYQAAYQTFNAEQNAASVNLSDALGDTDGRDYPVDNGLLNNGLPIESFTGFAGLVDLVDIFSIRGEQVKSFNHFVTQSGKMTTTGIYRPRQGYIAMQMDAGFENKNLKYHYRLPLVVNWQRSAIYVKPDVIMPAVALQLDNQLGMAWQDTWYKFTPKTTDARLSQFIAKNWLLALQDSLATLPAAQFHYLPTSRLTPNIANPSQPVTPQGIVIAWQQTADEQQQWYKEIVSRYIKRMDTSVASLNDTPITQAWQTYRTQLNQYLDNHANNKNADNKTDKRLNGQQVSFVIVNGQVKQVYSQYLTTLSQQPLQVNTWLTLNPDSQSLNRVNTPAYLSTLTSTIRDNPTGGNVLDGLAEIRRIRDLEPSRRLFGEQPEWLDAYKSYQATRQVTRAQRQQQARCQLLEDKLKQSPACDVTVYDIDVIANQQVCRENTDFTAYQADCQPHTAYEVPEKQKY